MAGHGGAHSNLRRFAVTNFPNGDDIRVLPQHRTQNTGKIQAGFIINLHLTNSVNMVFHWVL